MKTLIQGANTVPASNNHVESKKESFLSNFLPEDCKIETSSDAYYFSAIAFLCATFIFPPFIVGAVLCVVKAKKGGVEKNEEA